MKEEACEYGSSNPTHLSLSRPVESVERKKKPGSWMEDKEQGKSSCDIEDRTTKRPHSVIVHAGKSDGNESNASMEVAKPPEGVAPLTMEELSGVISNTRAALTTQKLLGRWKFGLTVLAKVFSDEIGTEPGSILVQMAGFPVRESRFRKEMEKLRNVQRDAKDDLIMEVDRDRHLLIQQTIKQLNQRFNRRLGGVSCTPLTLHKVKVTFTAEPGEGSGVARSFYAAIAEAFLSPERLPNLEHCQVAPSAASPTRSPHSREFRYYLRLFSS